MSFAHHIESEILSYISVINLIVQTVKQTILVVAERESYEVKLAV